MLVRSAYSSNIKERRDCSAALFDAARADGRPGRAHPGPPRRDARVGGGGDGPRPAARRRVGCSTTRTPAAPTCRTSPWSARSTSTATRSGTPSPGRTTPTSAAWSPGSMPPAPARPLAGRAGHPAGAAGQPGVLDEDVLELICANSRTPAAAARRLPGPDRREPAGRAAASASSPSAAGRRRAGRRSTRCIAYAERRTREALRALPDGTYRAAERARGRRRHRRRHPDRGHA